MNAVSYKESEHSMHSAIIKIIIDINIQQTAINLIYTKNYTNKIK